MTNGVAPARSTAPAGLPEPPAEAPPVRSRRSTTVQLAVTALLVLAACVMDVLIVWAVPGALEGCPPDRSFLECSDAMTVTVVPGLAAMASLLVWLVGSMARERRGGLVWCWLAVLVAAAPGVFLVPGLVV